VQRVGTYSATHLLEWSLVALASRLPWLIEMMLVDDAGRKEVGVRSRDSQAGVLRTGVSDAALPLCQMGRM
jgi:hypothetical protein